MSKTNLYIQYMYSYPHKTAYRTLENVSLKDYAYLLSGSGHGLYLHIPFCQTRCGYCNLFSVTGQKKEAADKYLKAVERQAAQYEEILSPFQPEFSDLTIGGGTPLFLEEAQLANMFRMLGQYFHFAKKQELVVETAPNQTTHKKLTILKQAGVTRGSMGIQSFSDQELKTLRRGHCARRAGEALALLKTFDFPCVNVDFIYGIPGQTTESLLASLKEALFYKPDEVFLYPLYIKHGAILERSHKETFVPDAAQTLSQYREAARYLRSEGFRQDSMRRFVQGEEKRPFQECGFGTSLALGCGGRSYLGNLHFCTPYAVTKEESLRQIEAFEHTTDFSRITHGILLSEEEMKRRYLIRHLLICPGLHMKRYERQFKSRALEDFPVLTEWMREGFVRISDNQDYLTLTEEGMGFSDYLGPKLISSDIWRKMQEWEAVHGRTDGSL